MDDILIEMNNQSVGQDRSVDLTQDESQNQKKGDKFKPLNMKEIQLQHSARLG